MSSVWGELKSRNVVKVAVAYAIVGWLLIEVTSTVLPTFGAPEWVLQTITFVIILGFPLALVLSWIFDLTPQGVERTGPGSQSESTTSVAGRKLDFAIIGLLVVAVGYLVVANYVMTDAPMESAATEDRRSVAVLPFSNRSAQADDQYFVDGMHDDILTQLARIASLKVISRTSVMGYRDTDKNMRTIGEELGVATILEGGVQRAGDTVRINVQLIDAATDEHLWAETYDRELTAENVFAIQSAMARAIADALQASLTPEDVERLGDVPTQNTRALDFYLTGKDFSNRPDDRTFGPLAAEMFEQAVTEDPDFALAWAELSRAHSNIHFYAIDPTPERLALAEQAAQRAVAIAPDLPEGHLAFAQHYDNGLNDYDRAAREFDLARQTLGNDPELIEQRSYMLRRMGNWRAAADEFRSLIDRDPRNNNLAFQLATTSFWLRDYDEALRYYDRALELVPDDSASYFFRAQVPWSRDGDMSLMKEAADNPAVAIGDRGAYLGWHAAIYERDYDAALAYLDRFQVEVFSQQFVYAPVSAFYGLTHQLAGKDDLAQPQYQSAREHLEAAISATPGDPRLHVALAKTLVGLEDREAADSAARTALELMPRSRDDLTGSFHQAEVVSGVYALSGNVEALVEELDPMLESSSRWSIEGLLPDPRFDPVRDDPRFQALVEKYRRQ